MERSASLQQLISAESENPSSHYIKVLSKTKGREKEFWKLGHQEEGDLGVEK